MNRGLSILFVAASLIVLAGCTVSGGGGGEPVVPRLQVANDPNAVLASGSLAPGASRDYRLDLTSDQVAQQALYIELESSLDLYVYNADGGLYATSSTPNFFAVGTAGLTSLGTAAEPLAVDALLTCRGSCVIRDADDPQYFVRIRNTTNSTQTFTLYSYVDSYEDVGEFANDTYAGAVLIEMGETERGAIESIGDIDMYYPAEPGELTFDTAATVNVVAEIVTSDGARIPIARGVPTDVFPDDTIEVWVLGDDEAAVSSESLYFLTLNLGG